MIVKQEVFGSMNNNCYLIVDENTNKSALVDCTEFSDKMIELIGESDLQYILLTHGHFDHILGVRQVREKYGCCVAISEEDAQMLTSGIKSLAVFFGKSNKDVDADIILSDGDIITLGKTEIKVLATPGHTKGSVCYIAENYIFSGDTLFYLTFGATDFPGGSESEMGKSLKKLKSLKGDYRVMTGHDELTTLDFERKNNPFMKLL